MRKSIVISIVVLFMTVSAWGATISVQPSSTGTTSGENVFLDINASTLTDLYAFQFDVDFDPTVVAAVGISEGSFLPSGGTTIFVPGSIDNIGGAITFNADSLIGSIPGVTGSGTLAVVEFTALNGGTSPITLSNVILLNSTLSNISVNSTNGSVIVQSTPEPASASFVKLGCVVLSIKVLWYRCFQKRRRKRA